MKKTIFTALTFICFTHTVFAQNHWQFYSTEDDYPKVNADEISLLPDDSLNASSTAFLMDNVPQSFILTFEYKTCDDDGDINSLWNSADGLAVGLGQRKYYYQKLYKHNPSLLAGANRGSIKQGNGVSIHFATYGLPGADPTRNRGLFILGTNNRVITFDNKIETYTNCDWEAVRISLAPNGVLRVYKGARVVEVALTATQVRQIRKGLISFSAATGAADSEHMIKDVELIRYQHAVHELKGKINDYSLRLTSQGLIVKHTRSVQQRLVTLTHEAVLAFDDVVFALPSALDLALNNITSNDPQQLYSELVEIESNPSEIDITRWYDDAMSLLLDLSVSMVLLNNGNGHWDALGTISSNFVPLMEYMIDSQPDLSEFQLVNIPGSSDDASNYRGLRLMQSRGITTRLAENSEIYSGGVNFFLAGSPSILNENPILGVHPWTMVDIQPTNSGGCILVEKSALEFPSDHHAHQPEILFLKELGIDESFYWFTLNAKPNTDDDESDIHILSEEELIAFGLLEESSID